MSVCLYVQCRVFIYHYLLFITLCSLSRNYSIAADVNDFTYTWLFSQVMMDQVLKCSALQSDGSDRLTILASLPGTKQEKQCPSVVCDINIYLRFYTLLIFMPSVTGECPGSGLTVTNQKRILTVLTNQSRGFSD